MSFCLVIYGSLLDVGGHVKDGNLEVRLDSESSCEVYLDGYVEEYKRLNPGTGGMVSYSILKTVKSDTRSF